MCNYIYNATYVRYHIAKEEKYYLHKNILNGTIQNDIILFKIIWNLIK